MLLDTVKNKAQCFSAATLSIEAAVSGLTCFLFEGSMETRCDDATWSVSAEVRAKGEGEEGREGGRGRPGRKGTLSSCTRTLPNCLQENVY